MQDHLLVLWVILDKSYFIGILIEVAELFKN